MKHYYRTEKKSNMKNLTYFLTLLSFVYLMTSCDKDKIEENIYYQKPVRIYTGPISSVEFSGTYCGSDSLIINSQSELDSIITKCSLDSLPIINFEKNSILGQKIMYANHLIQIENILVIDIVEKKYLFTTKYKDTIVGGIIIPLILYEIVSVPKIPIDYTVNFMIEHIN